MNNNKGIAALNAWKIQAIKAVRANDELHPEGSTSADPQRQINIVADKGRFSIIAHASAMSAIATLIPLHGHADTPTIMSYTCDPSELVTLVNAASQALQDAGYTVKMEDLR